MKQLGLFLLLIVLYQNKAVSQVFPDFGLPSAEDMNMKICSLDSEANAVMLVHEAISNYDDRYQLVTFHHYRYKILREKGIDYANITIPYWSESDYEFIDNIEAMTINQRDDGAIEKIPLERKAFYRQKITDRVGSVKFTFPAVKPGSIIEFQFRSTMKNYANLEDWTFQQEIPVIRSKYTLTVVPNAQFSYVVKKNDNYTVDIQQDKHEGRVSFEMKNIPPLKDEPYMDTRRDYLQQVVFQLSAYMSNGGKQKYMTSWDEVIRELLASRDLGVQLHKNLSETEAFIKEARANPDEMERTRMIYDYVQKNMSWNGHSTKYSPDGIKDAWEKKTGGTADVNLILINLLQEADLNASPLLVAERSFGKIDVNLPFVDQFNKLMAVVKIGDANYYLDATEKYVPVHVIPFSILNTDALVVERKHGGIIHIADDRFAYKENITVNATISDQGVFSGQAYISSTDYARSERLEAYEDDKEQYVEHAFRNAVPNMTVSDFKAVNEDNDSLPFANRFKFSFPLNASGGYTFIPVNLFTGFRNNPFLEKTRFSNINFGYRKTISANIFVQIPEGFAVDALPKSIKLTSEDNSIQCTREIIQDKNSPRLLARFRIENHKSFFSADEYSMLQAFYKKMIDLMNEEIVLKRKI